MDIHTLYSLAFRHFRPARLRRLYDALSIGPGTRLLDIGGSGDLWRMAASEGLPLPRLTILNLQVRKDASLAAADWVAGDGRHLPFADGAFDVAVSNSVVEHAGGWESQQRFAREVRRVARRYFVQTPDPRFPVEPHLLTPVVHWLPRRWQGKLLRNCTVWGLLTRPSPAQCARFYSGLRLLSHRELLQLFPGGRLLPERFLGLPKALIVTGNGDLPALH